MKEARYSAGPWSVSADAGRPWVIQCPANVGTGVVCTVSYRPNAYLIAAAPELFEQLCIALGHVDHMAKWISRVNAGEAHGIYSFESLGEDIEGIRSAIKIAVRGRT